SAPKSSRTALPLDWRPHWPSRCFLGRSLPGFRDDPITVRIKRLQVVPGERKIVVGAEIRFAQRGEEFHRVAYGVSPGPAPGTEYCIVASARLGAVKSHANSGIVKGQHQIMVGMRQLMQQRVRLTSGHDCQGTGELDRARLGDGDVVGGQP